MARIVILTTGSYFARTMMQVLTNAQLTVTGVILPGSEPPSPPDTVLHHQASSEQQQLVSLAQALKAKMTYVGGDDSKLPRRLEGLRPDFLLVACWPRRLEQAVIDSARNAALNLHPSLLPKYRGADPIGEQLAAKDFEFGVSLHLLAEQLDAGDIIIQASIDNAEKLERQTIEQTTARRGAALFLQAIEDFASDRWQPIAQQ